jgi:hypothetical protein
VELTKGNIESLLGNGAEESDLLLVKKITSKQVLAKTSDRCSAAPWCHFTRVL